MPFCERIAATAVAETRRRVVTSRGRPAGRVGSTKFSNLTGKHATSHARHADVGYPVVSVAGRNKSRKQSRKEETNRKKCLFISSGHGSMNQRLGAEMISRGYDVDVAIVNNQADIVAACERMLAGKESRPDVIVGPFLKTLIPPEVIGMNIPTIVVHPGPWNDAGPSSIDWALKLQKQEWGVTLFQCDNVFDHGAIYANPTFEVDPKLAKSTFYRKQCIDAAVVGLRQTIDALESGEPPKDRNSCAREGDEEWHTLPRMMKKDRKINWSLDAEDVVNTIRVSDSCPGATGVIGGSEYHCFNSVVERNIASLGLGASLDTFKPGEPIAFRNKSVLVKCGAFDGPSSAIWISHLKKPATKEETKIEKSEGRKLHFKLPAEEVLTNLAALQRLEDPNTFEVKSVEDGHDIFYTVDDQNTAYVYWEIYNGAFTTDDSQRLTKCINEVRNRNDVKVVVLMGGEAFWGNGINLNAIEAAADPAEESWRSINAIDDVVYAISELPQLTVAYYRANAGAGGVFVGFAADLLYSKLNVVFNPHYKGMGLFGSEYWTYNLPTRVGDKMAKKITDSCTSMSAHQALDLGMLDQVFTNDEEFRAKLDELRGNNEFVDAVTEGKRASADTRRQRMALCRDFELAKMKDCFVSEEYNSKRTAFVRKQTNTTWQRFRMKVVDAESARNAASVESVIYDSSSDRNVSALRGRPRCL